MPAIFRFRLVATTEFKLKESIGAFLFRTILAILELDDPDYASELIKITENGQELPPIRILAPPGGFRRLEIKDIEIGKPFNLKVAVLNEDAFEKLLKGVGKEARLQKGVTLNHASIRIVLFNTDKLLTYQDFICEGIKSESFKFNIEMPIVMKKLTIPTPQWIMDRLLESWERYSDTELPAQVIPDDILELQNFNLHSLTVQIDQKELQGVKGKIQFKLAVKDEAIQETIWALCNYAEFTGFGMFSHLGYGTVTFSHR